MDLNDELDVLLASNFTPQKICNVTFVLDQLPENLSVKVRALIDAEVVAAPKIAAVLSKYGFDIKDKSITRHRRRLRGSGCKCP